MSFRKVVKLDPDGSLLNSIVEKSNNMFSQNGIFCRKSTKQVVSMIVSGLGFQAEEKTDNYQVDGLSKMNMEY